MQAIASHPGVCALCPLPIVSGELIRRDANGGWVHVRCAEDRADRKRMTRVARPRMEPTLR